MLEFFLSYVLGIILYPVQCIEHPTPVIWKYAVFCITALHHNVHCNGKLCITSKHYVLHFLISCDNKCILNITGIRNHIIHWARLYIH